MTELQPCVVYLRVSTKKQAEAGTSLDDQKASTMRAAANLGYFVAANIYRWRKIRTV